MNFLMYHSGGSRLPFWEPLDLPILRSELPPSPRDDEVAEAMALLSVVLLAGVPSPPVIRCLAASHSDGARPGQRG